jgi:hypothetical protein
MCIKGMLLVGLFAVCAGAPPGVAPEHPATPKPPFSLRIAAVPDVARAGRPVVLRIVLTNKSSHRTDFAYMLTSEGEWYRVDVWDSDGTPVQPNPEPWRRDIDGRRLRAVHVPSTGIARLEPGHTLRDEYPLSQRFDLTKPGRYTVQASRFDDQTKTWVKSNKITLTVTP